MKVGIFFKVENDILVDVVNTGCGEPYGEAVQYGGHFDFWNKLRPRSQCEWKFKAHAYDYYPRGRVVYFPRSNSYHLYSDRCLSVEDTRMIVKIFGLEDQIFKLVRDEHYRCARCNPNFMG